MLLTAELLLNYQRCNRRAFLDLHGDITLRDETNDYVIKLIQDSTENQKSVLSGLDVVYQRPEFPARDWEAGCEATIALMAQGIDCIYQGVLLTEEAGVTLVSRPDLLIKQPGLSKFGDWLYSPVEIKLSKRSKTEYQVVVAYHMKVLAAVQEAWSESVQIFLKDKGASEIDLWEIYPRMEEVLADCIEEMRSVTPPEVFISRNRCSLCHWYSDCYNLAKSTNHLSLLPGVTQTRYNELVNFKITDLETLSKIDSRILDNATGFGPDNARRLVRQAQASFENIAFPTEAFPQGRSANYLLRTELSDSPIELYFDIESEPSLELIYLHGVLVVDRINQTEEFHALLAETPEGEARVWQEFLDLVWQYPTAPIYHFCPYEVQTVNKLAKQYKTSRSLIDPLLLRFVDLHERVTRLVVLPVESYALKSIARWMGFDWRDERANGAQSIYWYAQWLATGDREYLDSIVIYNEDDCRATHCMKNWLAEFLITQGEPSRHSVTVSN
jgi:predicted RecB family nuclease